ncbi:hypothetical protein [Arthrobacter sp. KNU40]|uniref:hypothetical protein n=1 Tax=Arthrobacter sp. KNU40 TaxID=3447965 RepID=UPI003F631BEF
MPGPRTQQARPLARGRGSLPNPEEKQRYKKFAKLTFGLVFATALTFLVVTVAGQVSSTVTPMSGAPSSPQPSRASVPGGLSFDPAASTATQNKRLNLIGPGNSWTQDCKSLNLAVAASPQSASWFKRGKSIDEIHSNGYALMGVFGSSVILQTRNDEIPGSTFVNLDLATGRVNWTYPDGGLLAGDKIVRKDETEKGPFGYVRRLTAISAATGAVLWDVRLDDSLQLQREVGLGAPPDSRSNIAMLNGVLWYAHMPVGKLPDRFFTVDLATGALVEQPASVSPSSSSGLFDDYHPDNPVTPWPSLSGC